MRIALVGGTGEIGKALALRLGKDTDFDLTIGSRHEDRAKDSAESYQRELSRFEGNQTISSSTNVIAAEDADIVVLAVPPYYITETIHSIELALDAGTILVSPAVGMKNGSDGLEYNPPTDGSVTELVARTAPDDVPVIGAFTTVPAKRVGDLEQQLDMHVPVVGDSGTAKEVITGVISKIRGLDPVDAGPLSNASEVEALTPLLINISKQNDELAELGIKFT